MNNIRPVLKRILAYSIDILIVLILASLISEILIFNNKMNKYQKTYQEYEEKYNAYAKYLNLLEEKYQDSEITEEEYNELISEEIYEEIIISKYEDKKITKGEYNKIKEEINTEYSQLAKDYIYKLNKQGVSNSIITLSTTLLYFGIIQYFLKGQTIGKKVLKLKVVSASNKELNVFNYILRTLIVNNILLNGISIIFLLLATKTVYLQADNILGMLVSISEAIIIFLVLTREDQRGLHDILFNTKVISIIKEETMENNSIKLNNNKTIDAEYQEKGSKDGKSKKQEKNRRKQ